MLREFRVDEKYLRVETEELLHTREAFAHADVEKINCLAAEYTDIPESTLRSLYDIDGKDVLFFYWPLQESDSTIGNCCFAVCGGL